jgi:hypothetical protein
MIPSPWMSTFFEHLPDPSPHASTGGPSDNTDIALPDTEQADRPDGGVRNGIENKGVNLNILSDAP